MDMEKIIEQWRDRLPPTFLGKEIDTRTEGQFRWETIQNRKFLGQIPRDCFIYSGRQVLIVRDPFLSWWQSTLSTKAPAVTGNFKRKRGRPSVARAAVS